MARKKIEVVEKKPEEYLSELLKLIPTYGEENTKCNALKKTVAELNSKIKELVKKAKMTDRDIEGDGWKINLAITDESTMNEDRLLELAHKYKLDSIIKTKEYIDFDVLESLIYKGELSKKILEEMDKCKEPKTKETLRVSKLKESKGE